MHTCVFLAVCLPIVLAPNTQKHVCELKARSSANPNPHQCKTDRNTGKEDSRTRFKHTDGSAITQIYSEVPNIATCKQIKTRRTKIEAQPNPTHTFMLRLAELASKSLPTTIYAYGIVKQEGIHFLHPFFSQSIFIQRETWKLTHPTSCLTSSWGTFTQRDVFSSFCISSPSNWWSNEKKDSQPNPIFPPSHWCSCTKSRHAILGGGADWEASGGI